MMAKKPKRVKLKSSGIKLGDLYRTFDDEKPKKRKRWQWLLRQGARAVRRGGGQRREGTQGWQD